MSTVVSKADDLKNITELYNVIYGSDIRIKSLVGKSSMGLAIENGDFGIAGIVEGNLFNEAILITIQRYLVELYTPLSFDGLSGSNFLRLIRSLDGISNDLRIKILKAELLLIGLRIPQIKTIDTIEGRIIGTSVISFEIGFELITGELSNFAITGVI